MQTQITLSKSLLITAQANEKQKLAAVTQKGAKFAKASRDLASFSGVPAAREVLATRAAYCLYELNEAKNNHAKAVKNRKNMQKKLDLNQEALKILEDTQEQTLLVGKHQSNQINIYTIDAIRKISKIDSLQTQYRLTNDSRDLYSVKDISNSDLSTSDLGIDLSIYNEIERQFLEESVFDVVDGKIVAKRNKIFDKNEKDGNNKSNLERMQEGNASLCKDGMSMELHHLK
ncbi:hypothetical protein Yangon222_14820 [Helicobacter pylori]